MSDQGSQNIEALKKSLVEIAIESWRFSRLFARVLNKLDAGEAPRYANQLRYYVKGLEEHLALNGLSIVNIEGQIYDPGMPVSALNISDFDVNDLLGIEQMIEPIIMQGDALMRTGTVMLGKVRQ